MQFEHQAVVYSAYSIHSNKTDRDFFKIGLIVDGSASEFFVTEKVYTDFLQTPVYNIIASKGVPQMCAVQFDLRFTEKGPRVNVNAIKAGK